MASSAGSRNPNSHVLHFASDQHDRTTLTVLVNNVRFHIAADGKSWKKDAKSGNRLAEEYARLLNAVKAEEDRRFTKPCSKANLRSGSQDSAHGTSDGEDSTDKDSAVDMMEDKLKDSQFLAESKDDPHRALQNWMLSPFGSIFEAEAPRRNQKESLSVQDWYERPTLFYSLDVSNAKLQAQEENATEELERKMADNIPRLYAPKWMRQLNVPWYPAKDLTVHATSDDPEPYHPIIVSVGNEKHFIKMVDPDQAAPTKREIDLLMQIEKKGLHKKIRVPQVKGLVGFGGSKTEMMGFLQTMIDDPTPLTKMLDDDIPQEKRDRWADESEKMKQVLHDNDIIWGDAKADNFMVDKHDKLWIIDFGGSYTDGWIDPELMETREGDDMGVERIVNALHDPNANTWDPEEDQTLPFQPEEEKGVNLEAQQSSAGKKRKADSEESPEDQEVDGDSSTAQDSRKRMRTEEETEKDVTDEATSETPEDAQADEAASDAESDGPQEDEDYCYCSKPASGDMIGCDSAECTRQWFHFECVGLKSAPKSRRWYCRDCENTQE